jgi:hypothetical protein
MANRCLYLHETIDILGTGSEAYKAHTGRLGTDRTDGGSPLVGTWQQSGSTGTWPTVINLWEMRGWDHWTRRAAIHASGQEPKLKKWWAEATKYRQRLRPDPRAGAVEPDARQMIERRVQDERSSGDRDREARTRRQVSRRRGGAGGRSRRIAVSR